MQPVVVRAAGVLGRSAFRGPCSAKALAAPSAIAGSRQQQQQKQQRCWFSAEPAAQRKKSVMFVCKRNSCRSQMAEGWAKHLAKNDLDIQSSGLEGSRVHPTAKVVMQEVGVDITSHTSDFLHDFSPSSFDAVVSMCGCGTSLPEQWQKADVFEDWQLDDPDGQPLETFRRVRSEIKHHVKALVGKIEKGQTTPQSERDAMAKGPNEC